METELVDLLLDETDITDLVEDRIYPHGQAPQDAPLPFLIYEVAGCMRPLVLGGGVVTVVNYTINITGFSNSEADLRDLMDAVEATLHGTSSGNLKSITLQDISSNPNPENPQEFSEGQTYSIWFERG